MKINIIRQDALKYRRVTLIRRINLLVTFGSIGLFTAAILSSVDFGAPGVIVAGVRLSNLNDYDLLVSNVKNVKSLPDFLFSAIAEKTLTRGLTGSYQVTLELKIKHGG